MAGLGFTGAEVPVRDTAHVTPAEAESKLPGFVERLGAEGVEVISIAGDLAESTFAACRAAGVPLIRVMAELGPDGYASSVARVRKRLEEAAPLAERYGVQIGVPAAPRPLRLLGAGGLAVARRAPGRPVPLVWDAGA